MRRSSLRNLREEQLLLKEARWEVETEGPTRESELKQSICGSSGPTNYSNYSILQITTGSDVQTCQSSRFVDTLPTTIMEVDVLAPSKTMLLYQEGQLSTTPWCIQEEILTSHPRHAPQPIITHRIPVHFRLPLPAPSLFGYPPRPSPKCPRDLAARWARRSSRSL